MTRQPDRSWEGAAGGMPPHAVTWIATALLVDTVVWWELAQLPAFRDKLLVSPVLVAAGLCWAHAFVTPIVVWRRPGRLLNRVVAIGVGGVLAALPVVGGGLGGVAVGIPTVFTGAILGCLAGGALTGVAAAWSMRLLTATRGMISLRRTA